MEPVMFDIFNFVPKVALIFPVSVDLITLFIDRKKSEIIIQRTSKEEFQC
jgi:hypothetical protein